MRRTIGLRLAALLCALSVMCGNVGSLSAEASGEVGLELGRQRRPESVVIQDDHRLWIEEAQSRRRSMVITDQGEQPDMGELDGVVLEVSGELGTQLEEETAAQPGMEIVTQSNAGTATQPGTEIVTQSNAGTATQPDGENEIPTDAEFGLTARSAILMEASTGTVIYELNGDEQLSPASITKIMTLILIFEALENGRISLNDQVTTSAYAKSMGGSQVFLEEGEVQSVETMIKCIVVASGNDASVAMAEHLAGSETEFVRQMNEKAKSLGMTGTNFEDCCGLTDSLTHVTTARDVAIMSRELITKYPKVKEYATIWMENITHVTSKGSSEFGLANTNKLLKMSNSFKVTGLKTGSTSLAKYCLSATAEKDGVEMIAVIMAAENYKLRFSEAQTLLNYGYSNCSLYRDDDSQRQALPSMLVKNGVESEVPLSYDGEFTYLMFAENGIGQVETQLVLEESVQAPVVKGQKVGSLNYLIGGKMIGSVDVVAAEDVEAADFWDYLAWLWNGWRLSGRAA